MNDTGWNKNMAVPKSECKNQSNHKDWQKIKLTDDEVMTFQNKVLSSRKPDLENIIQSMSRMNVNTAKEVVSHGPKPSARTVGPKESDKNELEEINPSRGLNEMCTPCFIDEITEEDKDEMGRLYLKGPSSTEVLSPATVVTQNICDKFNLNTDTPCHEELKEMFYEYAKSGSIENIQNFQILVDILQNKRILVQYINSTDRQQRWTPLVIAIRAGNLFMVDLLLSMEADASITCPRGGSGGTLAEKSEMFTPLQHVILQIDKRHEHALKCVDLLMQKSKIKIMPDNNALYNVAHLYNIKKTFQQQGAQRNNNDHQIIETTKTIIGKLISGGCDVTETNKFYNRDDLSSFLKILQVGDVAFIEQILNNLSEQEKQKLATLTNRRGMNVLHHVLALKEDQVTLTELKRLVTIFFKYGANLRLLSLEHQKPINYAVGNYKKEMQIFIADLVNKHRANKSQ